jgi:hypothetical protein
MDDRTLLAVCIADEARNQPHEGMVAVGRVVMNRMHLRFFSDATMAGTVLHYMQFSGFWCDMVAGKYTTVAHSPADAEARAEAKLARYSSEPGWEDVLLAADQARGVEVFSGGPEYQKINGNTVLYYNPAVVKAPPAWATPDKLDAVIYAHTFYHA